MRQVADLTVAGRGVKVIILEPGETLDRMPAFSVPYKCGIAFEANWDLGWLRDLIRRLLQGGASYLSFYGDRSDDANGIADVVREEDTVESDEYTVLTVSEPPGALHDFIEGLQLAMPSEGFIAEQPAYLIICVSKDGDSALAAAILDAFRKRM